MAAAKAEEKRIALVIGNGSYMHVHQLPNAVHDAEAMAAELGLPLHGFQVIYGHDLPLKSMWGKINDFTDAALHYNVALFYYAGHGVQINNTNWLIPIDISDDLQRGADLQGQSVSMAQVTDMMAEANPAGVNLLIIDACRDNPFAGNGRTTGAARGLATTAGANGVMILYSAGSGQTALDGLTPNDKNGLFTQELLEAMRQPGVPISQMIADLQDVVRQRAETVHHLQTPAYYAEQNSRFMFTPRALDPSGVMVPPIEPGSAKPSPQPPRLQPAATNPGASAKPQVGVKPSAPAAPKPLQTWHGDNAGRGSNDPNKTCTSLGVC
jgi:uncharacterized caspase-like protein